MTRYLESWLGLKADQWVTLHRAFQGQSDADVVKNGGTEIGRRQVQFDADDNNLIYLKSWAGQTRADLYKKGSYQVVADNVSWNE